MNANEENARKVFDEYNCKGVPHLLFVDDKGNEVDRIIGYLPPSEYLARIQDIINNKHTLDDYISQYENGKANAEIIAGIALKYEDRGDSDNAKKFYTILIKDFPDPSSEYYQRGTYFLASDAFEKGVSMALNAYIASFPDSPFIEDAFFTMAYHYAEEEMAEEEIKVYLKMIDHFPKNLGALNSYAWRMSELEMRLEDALKKVQKAVILSADSPNSQANIIDTEAEVLWKLKRFDAAIDAIEKAISIDPKNDYFRDQKEKFIQSKKEASQPV
ncbi:MAG: hypothetical protein H8E85_01085 [Candidatus Marinimicrobia bacterium]|nr:hypothetical protein [Candidatus Neomarinimicrobiota bacterium]